MRRELEKNVSTVETKSPKGKERYGWFGPNLPLGISRLTKVDSEYLRARDKRLKREDVLGGMAIDIDSNYIDSEIEVSLEL